MEKPWNFEDALPRLRRCATAMLADRIEPLRADMIARAAIKTVLGQKLPVADPAHLRRALYKVLLDSCRRQNIDHHAEASHSQNALLSGFARLSPEEREVLVLVAIEGLPHKDAAITLDLPLFALEARLTRAREHLLNEARRQHLHYQVSARRAAHLRVVK